MSTIQNVRRILGVVVAGCVVVPSVVLAQIGSVSVGVGSGRSTFTTYLVSITKFINEVVIPFLLGIGFLFFVWGVFRYFVVGGSDPKAREEGRQVVIYAITGFVLIFVFWGIVQLLAGATGLWKPAPPATVLPTLPSALPVR